jgi:hypothetical protein
MFEEKERQLIYEFALWYSNVKRFATVNLSAIGG